MLSEQLQTLLQRGWRLAFPTASSHRRAMQHAMALPCVLGRRTITRTLCALGRSEQDWSADYKLFSRCRWRAEQLFQPVLDEHLQRYPKGPIFVAVDDTKLRKTGKKIPGTGWQRDPLSPPFHVNFLYGLRFLQASLLFPHYREGDYSARALPVRFQEAAVVKKPGKRASEEQLKEYKRLKQIKNLSTQTLELLRDLRTNLDERGGRDRLLLMLVTAASVTRLSFGLSVPAANGWLAVAKMPGFALLRLRLNVANTLRKYSLPNKCVRIPRGAGSAYKFILVASAVGCDIKRCKQYCGNEAALLAPCGCW